MADDPELLRAIRELYTASVETTKVLNSVVHEVDGSDINALNSARRALRKARELLKPLVERFGERGLPFP